MGASQAPDAGAVPVWRSKFYIMIRITNQEEFKKCCEMCNSKDLESRYLGLSLLEECVEHLNTGNIIIKVIFPEKTIYQYDWFEFIDVCVSCSNYDSFGNVLYNLLYRGIYKEYSATFILKENDQNN